jgi:hypothetical protein
MSNEKDKKGHGNQDNPGHGGGNPGQGHGNPGNHGNHGRPDDPGRPVKPHRSSAQQFEQLTSKK